MLAMAASSAMAQGDAAKGKDSFSQCSICHATDTDEVKVGPSLKGLFMKEGRTEATVTQKIKEGGNGMPPYGGSLSDAVLADIIAYLKTL
jgi:cytochrome c2